MIYRVFNNYGEHKTTTKALCKDRKTAESYVEYLLEEEKRIQKEYPPMRGAFVPHDIDEILEDEDIIKLLKK